MRQVEALWTRNGPYLNLIINQEEAPKVGEHVFHHMIVATLGTGNRAEAQAALSGDIERSIRILMPDS